MQRSLRLWFCAGLLLGACADDDTDPVAVDASTGAAGTTTDAAPGSSGEAPGSSGEAPGDASTGSPPGPTAEELLGCDGELEVLRELAGPGYDPATGLIDPQESYVAHTTQILVDPEKLDAFLADSEAVGAQLMETPGLVAVGFANDPVCGFSRTVGIWRSEEAMYQFVASGAHLQAMANSPTYTLAGRTTHWSISAEEIPVTWETALRQLEAVDPLPY